MDDIKLAMLGSKEAAKRLTDAGVLVMQGDCLELLKDIPDGSVDMVLCDLPYGSTACKWDTIIPFDPLWEQYKRLIKPNGAIVLFGSEPFSSKLRMSNLEWFKYDWVWRHGRCANFAQAPYMALKEHEIVSVFSSGGCCKTAKNRMTYNPQGLKNCEIKQRGKGHSDLRPSRTVQPDFMQLKTGYPKSVLEFSKEQAKYHPTQKPIALLEYLIRTYTNPGMTVLDNCMGSGSTGVACVNTGRNFIGMELDPGYFEVAKRRIEEAQAQARLAWNTRAPILSESEMEVLDEYR